MFVFAFLLRFMIIRIFLITEFLLDREHCKTHRQHAFGTINRCEPAGSWNDSSITFWFLSFRIPLSNSSFFDRDAAAFWLPRYSTEKCVNRPKTVCCWEIGWYLCFHTNCVLHESVTEMIIFRVSFYWQLFELRNSAKNYVPNISFSQNAYDPGRTEI